MMIEDLYKTTDKLNKHIENMALNKVNIEFLTKQMEKALNDIEELKDDYIKENPDSKTLDNNNSTLKIPPEGYILPKPKPKHE